MASSVSMSDSLLESSVESSVQYSSSDVIGDMDLHEDELLSEL